MRGILIHINEFTYQKCVTIFGLKLYFLKKIEFFCKENGISEVFLTLLFNPSGAMTFSVLRKAMGVKNVARNMTSRGG